MQEIARRCVVKFETHFEVGERSSYTNSLNSKIHTNTGTSDKKKFQSLNLFTDRQESEQGNGWFWRVPLLQEDHDETWLHLIQTRAHWQVRSEWGFSRIDVDTLLFSSRYPMSNNPTFTLDDTTSMFCLPLGANIECWREGAANTRCWRPVEGRTWT